MFGVILVYSCLHMKTNVTAASPEGKFIFIFSRLALVSIALTHSLFTNLYLTTAYCERHNAVKSMIKITPLILGHLDLFCFSFLFFF